MKKMMKKKVFKLAKRAVWFGKIVELASPVFHVVSLVDLAVKLRKMYSGYT